MTASGAGTNSQEFGAPQRRLFAAHPASAEANGRSARRRNSAHNSAETTALPSRAAPPIPLAEGLFGFAQTLIEALGLVGLAVALLGGSGNVIAANRPFAALTPRPMRPRPRRSMLAEPNANCLIAEATRVDFFPQKNTCARTIPIHDGNGKLAAIGHVVPIGNAGNGAAADVRAMLIIDPLGLRAAPSPLLPQQLFGLSKAEARVACGIAEGRTVATMAAEFGVSRETVRCQLKNVLAKTGTGRQANLAVLLGGLRAPTI